MRQIGFPAAYIWLRAGDGDGIAINRHGEDLVALGEGVGHQRSDPGDIDGQWIDAHIGLAGQLGQPQGQAFQVQVVARVMAIGESLAGQKLQRVQRAVGRVATSAQRLFGSCLADQSLIEQAAQ
ncbi:hypothetical protein D3C76_1487210 [compost metagenome]